MDDQFSPQDPGNLPFRFRQKPVPAEKTAASWQQIGTRIAGQRNNRPRRSRVWMALAAVAALPLIAYASYYVYCSIVSLGMHEYRTAYGEIKRVVLPDSSVVYLNANSTLRTRREWNASDSRGVWLDGEAYFEVTKKQHGGNAKFIVHTPALDVAVLGTRFNVNMMGARTTVSLREGRVQLTARAPISNGQHVIMMKPGDEVQVEKDQSRLKEAINIDLIADWRNHRYHFENTSVSDIAELIYSKFGYRVVILSPGIEQRTISGDLYAENIAQLSRALSITMNIQIETKDEQLLFSVKD